MSVLTVGEHELRVRELRLLGTLVWWNRLMSDERGSLWGIQTLPPYAFWLTGPYAAEYYRRGPDWVQGRVRISRGPKFPETYFFDPVHDNAQDPVMTTCGGHGGFIVHQSEIPAILAGLRSDARSKVKLRRLPTWEELVTSQRVVNECRRLVRQRDKLARWGIDDPARRVRHWPTWADRHPQYGPEALAGR